MELRDLPIEIVTEFETITRYEVARYRTHPNHDDMLSRARYVVWRSLARLDPDRRPTAHPFVRRCARWACLEFLKSPENCQRRWDFNGKPVPAMLQWELVTDTASTAAPDVPLVREWSRFTEPDFAPELIEQLWRESLWEEVEATLSPENVRELRGWLRGEVYCGREGKGRYVRFQRMLNATRRRYGMPTKQLDRWTPEKARKQRESRKARQEAVR